MAVTKLYGRFRAFISMQTGIIFRLCQLVYASTPFMKTTLRSNPKLILHPHDLHQQFLAAIWNLMAEGVDNHVSEMKRGLVPARASGTVLEIGAGCGHSAKYLDPTRVKTYIALEPNVLHHKEIYLNATQAGFQSSQIMILSCGAEESAKILESLRGKQVDTILSILTLCGIPTLENTLENLVRDVLKPGGCFIFLEHVRSDVWEVKLTQMFWTPLWQFVVGCRLDSRSHHILEDLPVDWSERMVEGEEDVSPMSLFRHQWGFLVKAA